MINLDFKKQCFWPDLLNDKNNIHLHTFASVSLLKSHLIKQILEEYIPNISEIFLKCITIHCGIKNLNVEDDPL